MSDKEIQGLIQNAFQKTLKEFQENPDNVFNYLELQEKYNRVLKDKVNLQKQNQKYKEVIDSAKALVNNVYNSLENADKPIKFYEELLDILNINERN